METELVTVFTPTYNRGDKLIRVYTSVLAQTYKNLEWLIIDDGSKDSTKEVVEQWRKEKKVNIRYIYQQNRGKFWSIWNGLQEAKGEWFLIADSDDEFVPEAIETFLKYWKLTESNAKSEICGISGLCCWNDTKQMMGEPFPHSPMVSDAMEIFYKYKVTGEKWGILRTSKLKEFYPFEVPQDILFISESYIWNQMAMRYKTIYINEVLRVCWRSYLEGGGLTANYTIEKHSMGMYLSENMNFKCSRKYHWRIKDTLLCSLRLLYASVRSKVALNAVLQDKKGSEKVLLLCLYPVSRLVGYLRKKQYERSGC